MQLDDRWLLCLPLYHVGGLSVVIRSAIYGTAVVLQNGFDVSMVCDALEHQAVTLVSLVPTQLYRLLDTLPSSLPHLRLILLGGAAATPDLLTRAAHLPVATTYGLTEACSQVATALPDAATVKPGTVGKPLPGISIQVVDDQGSRCRRVKSVKSS